MILIKMIKAEMEILCAQRESANGLRKTDLENGWTPAGPVGNLEWGATYLDQIDSRWRRSYSIHSGGFSTETQPLIGQADPTSDWSANQNHLKTFSDMNQNL